MENEEDSQETVCVSLFMCRRQRDRGEENEHMAVCGRRDSCQCCCPPAQRSAAGIAPQQPDVERKKTQENDPAQV